MGSFHKSFKSKLSLLKFIPKVALLSFFVQTSNAEVIEFADDITVTSTLTSTPGIGCEIPASNSTIISNLTVDTVTNRVSYHTTADDGEDISYTANFVKLINNTNTVIFHYKENVSKSFDDGKVIYKDDINISFISTRGSPFRQTETFTKTTILESGTTICVDTFKVQGTFVGGVPMRLVPFPITEKISDAFKNAFSRDGKGEKKSISEKRAIFGVRG
jgi:hypothetical protein